ncbi:MAG: protein kinase [Holophagales bacterium]|nr:protein kinase [Holophagales bacterium]MYF94216.1 protein kinase [Holophagales bacterium]
MEPDCTCRGRCAAPSRSEVGYVALSERREDDERLLPDTGAGNCLGDTLLATVDRVEKYGAPVPDNQQNVRLQWRFSDPVSQWQEGAETALIGVGGETAGGHESRLRGLLLGTALYHPRVSELAGGGLPSDRSAVAQGRDSASTTCGTRWRLHVTRLIPWAAVPDAPSSALPPGHRLAEYEIVRVLGAGGFGITYLAFDHRLDGPVAIKEYFPVDLATRSDGWRVSATATTNQDVFAWGLDRFLDEARALHRLRHPNVVRAHRYLEANGTAYIVMEYVEGESLKSILDRRKRLPAAEWRPWMEALMSGLAHVHEHGYLHRDIKPANIVVRAEDGEPVLIDFGAARVQHRDRTHTKVLTAGYAPIEQYSTGAIQGPPADIYALAAVSYRVLTGDVVPSAPDRMLRDDYEPLTEHVVAARPEWLAAIDHGLAMRPEDRPDGVGTWRRRLRSATGGAAADGIASRESPPDAEAQFNLGKMYAEGLGVPHDDAEAVRWYRLAAEQGHAEAQFNLGWMCEWGRGVSRNDADAARWYRLAAEQGHAGAQRDLERTSSDEVPEVRPLPTSSGTDADYFGCGSHSDDVLRLQGRPTRIDGSDASAIPGWDIEGEETWHYGPGADVTIGNRSHEVLGWWNYDGQLKVRTLPGCNGTNADHFNCGSHSDDVLRLQGTPTGIERNRFKGDSWETWYYGPRDEVAITRNHRVVGWWNPSGRLKAQTLPGSNRTGADYFTRGSHSDDVLRLQGTPTGIERNENLGEECWYFGQHARVRLHRRGLVEVRGSHVAVSTRTREVLSWWNRGGQLKVRLLPGSNVTDADYFTRGSHPDDVLRLLGTPTGIERDKDEDLGNETWSYGDNEVYISTRTHEIIGWNNEDGQLKVRLLPGSNSTDADYFTEGSHSDDVLRLQGTPTILYRESDSTEWWQYCDEGGVQICTRTREVLWWDDYTGQGLKATGPDAKWTPTRQQTAKRPV